MKKRNDAIVQITALMALSEADPLSLPLMSEEYVQCSAGALRVLHFRAPHPAAGRPVVFLSGWGTSPEGFSDFFTMIRGTAECYYVETREKNSSKLPRQRVPMDMDQNARDLAEVIDHLQLTGKDYLLMGTCWGATVAAHALATKTAAPGTAVLYDPMPRLWFPRWLLKIVVPAVPVQIWNLLLPLGRMVALWGMKEERQRQRAYDVISHADLRKWKQAALDIGNYDLEKLLDRVRQEVCVFTGVADKIHDQGKYPALAKSMPRGRLFDIGVEEDQRESLIGLIAREFATIRKDDGIPPLFRGFEKNLHQADTDPG